MENVNYFVTMHRTPQPGIYLLVGRYAQKHVAEEVFDALRSNVISPEYDRVELKETTYDRLPYMQGAVAINEVVIRRRNRGKHAE